LLARALAASASSVILFAYVASTLPSVSDLGLFQGTQSIIVIGVILGGSGLSRAAIRFISTQIGAGNEDQARNLYSASFRIGVILSGFIAAGMYLLSSYISVAVFHDVSYQILIQLASLDVFLFSMIILSISLMYSMQEFRKTSIISIINSVLKTGSAVVLLAVGLGIEGIVWGFVVGDSVAFALFLLLLRPRLLLRRVSNEGTIPLLRFSLPLFGSSILDFLAREIDVYLLLVIASLYVAGIYSPAVMLASILFLLQTSLDQALAPFF
jgi:O-antigen/teichoic acid export membrane protein